MDLQGQFNAAGARSDQNKTRFLSLDIARGILILMVVFMHAYSNHILKIASEEEFVVRLWDQLVSVSKPIRMPAFFLISGFLAKNIVRGEWQTLFSKRVYFLSYMFLIWHLVNTAAINLFLYFEGDPRSLYSIAVGFAEKLVIPTTFLWFLWALVLYTILAKASFSRPRWLIMSLAVATSAFSEILSDHLSYIARCGLFFFIGSFYPSVITTLLSRARWSIVAVLAFGYIASIGIILALGEKFPGVWLPASAFGSAMAVMAAGLAADWRILKPFSYVGNNTFQVYVLHFIMIWSANYAVTYAFPSVGAFIGNNDVVLLVYPIFFVAAVVLACLITHRLAMKIGLTWLFQLPRLQKGDRLVPRGRWARISGPENSDARPRGDATPLLSCQMAVEEGSRSEA